MLPLLSAWAHETGLSTKAGIPELWDSSVPDISGIGADTVCSFSPQYRLEGPVSVPGCYISAFCYTDEPERPRLTGRYFRDPRACLHCGTID